MASVTQRNQGNEAMTDESSEDNEHDQLPEKSGGAPAAVASSSVGRRGGFFTIYKKGQGYWTRMGTVLAAAMIALMSADFIYSQMNAIPYGKAANGDPLYIPRQVSAGVAIGFLVVVCFIVWRLINKPSHVDFLIATDSEMKKVNWTTKKELLGSTKVVIFFVILIALILFGLDVVFGYFFHLIKVLDFGPFQ
jgi:preprotein translocase subunit SecE